MVFVLGVTGPLFGESVASDVADPAVDDGFLAMVAVIQAAEIAQGRRMKANESHAGIEHQLRQLFVHLVTAGGIDEQPHLHALPCLRSQRVCNLAADGALPPDIRLDVHALFRAGDVAQQEREKLIAVLEELDVITSLEA